MLGPELVQLMNAAVQKIKVRIQTVQSQQKSYADTYRRGLEFAVGDHVFLKVAPMTGVMRFGTKGKLSPRFISPFDFLERVERVAYRLALPPALATIHNLFHMSMLRKYTPNPSYVIEYANLPLQRDLRYKEEPIGILLRNRSLETRRFYSSKWCGKTSRRRSNLGVREQDEGHVPYFVLGLGTFGDESS